MKIISVIIPVYNTKLFLKEAIDSVLNQQEYIKEIIIIDDGSTDGSGKFIDEVYKDNTLINILYTSNKGQGHARNLGIEKSTGKYLYFFDSDDILIDGLFKSFYAKINKGQVLDLFCFSGESFLDKGYSKENISNPNLLAKNAYKRKLDSEFETGEEAFIRLIEIAGFFAGPPFYICSSDLLKKNNIRFGHDKYEDEDFTHRLFLNAQRTLITNKVFFKRRIRAGSTMQRYRNFDHLNGYINTVKTLNDLKEIKLRNPKTIEVLKARIERFSKEVIMMKYNNSITVKGEQRKIYHQFIKNYILKNLSLSIFFLKFPILQKLRKIKSFLIN